MEALKIAAAKAAMQYVKSGMVVGLGSGSTASIFVELLGRAINQGKLTNIKAIPTSKVTEKQARALGIPITALSVEPVLNLAVDGADQVDPELNLIKGLGGALLREKIVEQDAKRFLVIVDKSKIVDVLGKDGWLPVEIVPFEAEAHKNWLSSLGCTTRYAQNPDGSLFLTDSGNWIVHCSFQGGISNPYELSTALNNRAGIVEHGLFLNMADVVIAGHHDGVNLMERNL
jgi:ribose 5-phosphate isomerase A